MRGDPSNYLKSSVAMDELNSYYPYVLIFSTIAFVVFSILSEKYNALRKFGDVIKKVLTVMIIIFIVFFILSLLLFLLYFYITKEIT